MGQSFVIDAHIYELFTQERVTIGIVKGSLKYLAEPYAIFNVRHICRRRANDMIEIEVLRIVLIIVISYLLGSIPTAYIVAKTKGVNIFEVGSGNMGATNVIRVMGLWWGLLVWAFDSLKGILAIVIANQLLPDNPALATALAATIAVIGHNWSLFAKSVTGTLRGGKGAAIWFGTMLVIAPFQVIAGMCLLGGLVIAATRYVSLAVLSMLILSMLWVVLLVRQGDLPFEYTFYFMTVTVMVLYRFRENIQRLLAGTERRLGDNG